ncbi:MAG: PTS-dependent dihydroxyacetone kinase phosphotransferase subunit DhaM [Lachnospiraceae bacterium]|nr:PTS-dependent dihydroxyacetone kinase phosphotransferase subunit DhaM [Lachnospiraceae bacterium]
MVGIVIVSHSSKIAEGARELAAQMCPGFEGIYAAGGMEDGSIGTDAIRIKTAIEAADSGDGVVILADLGSGILSTETAIDLLETGIDARIADAPIVEGAVVAAVQASVGSSIDEVISEAEQTRQQSKIS